MVQISSCLITHFIPINSDLIGFKKGAYKSLYWCLALSPDNAEFICKKHDNQKGFFNLKSL